MKSLKPRLLTAVIGIPILLIVLFISELWRPFVGIVIGAFSAFMTGEYLQARKMLYKFHLSIPCMLFAFLLSVLVTTKYLYVLIFAFILTVFAVMIFKHEKTNYADVAYSVFGTFLISFGMSAVPIACASSVSITFCYICIFALPWMADAGGFFIGASFGKHKLCPKISPKKTVEGAIGGILFCDLTTGGWPATKWRRPSSTSPAALWPSPKQTCACCCPRISSWTMWAEYKQPSAGLPAFL